MKKHPVGIIGFGRFGQLMARYLSGDCNLFIHDLSVRPAEPCLPDTCRATLETVCAQPIVILAVPISSMKDLLAEISGLIGENTIIIDVCSVKVLPMRWMRELLPAAASILGTHPMFGPDSAAQSVDGKKIVLCRQRMPADAYDRIRAYLTAKGLVVIETTAEAHDRQIAVSLSLTHFIGRSLSQFGAARQDIDTEGYQRLLYTLDVVEHDTWQLFMDMHRYNPFAGEVRKRFMEAMHAVDDAIMDRPVPSESG